MMTDAMNPLSPEEHMEVLFLLTLLEDQFGGVPSLGVCAGGDYVVKSTCPCEICSDFRKTYKCKPKTTILAAAKAYGDDMLCHMQTVQHAQSGRVPH